MISTGQQKRFRWHSSRTTAEIGLNDREQRARGAKKNNEERTKKLRSAKPSVTQPSLLETLTRRAIFR